MDMEGSGKPGGVYAQFYRAAKRDVFHSIESGAPIDIGVDMVKIGLTGEVNNNVFEVTAVHKARFPAEWLAYQEGREQIGNGMPLDMLFPGNPEVVSTLRARQIHTVEQLADMPDSAATNIPFGATWKQKAQQFLLGKQDNRFPKLEADNADLRAQLAEMKAMVDALTAPKPDAAAVDTVVPKTKAKE